MRRYWRRYGGESRLCGSRTRFFVLHRCLWRPRARSIRSLYDLNTVAADQDASARLLDAAPAETERPVSAQKRKTPPTPHQGGAARRDNGRDSGCGRNVVLEARTLWRDTAGRREVRRCPSHAAQLLFQGQEKA